MALDSSLTSLDSRAAPPVRPVMNAADGDQRASARALPTELYEQIFKALLYDPDSLVAAPRDARHVEPVTRCLLNLRATSSTFASLADDDYLWYLIGHRRWTLSWLPNLKRRLRKESMRQVYIQRFLADLEAYPRVEAIINEPQERLIGLAKLIEIDNDEERLLDMLARRIAVATNAVQQQHDQSDTASHNLADNTLAVRYWAVEIMGAMKRRSIARSWSPTSGPLTFERGLALMSEFRFAYEYPLETQLEAVAAFSLAYFSEHSIAPGDSNAVVTTLWGSLVAQGFGPAEARYYHDLAGAFPDAVLDYHRRTLPLSLVWVLCSVGKRLGIDIAPIGWPGTVMALVLGVQAKWETGDADEAKYIAFQGGCYFSPFDAVLATRAELSARLSGMPLPAPLHHLHLDPASSRDMVARCARNMLHVDAHTEQQFPDRWSQSDSILAMYAALVALHSTGASNGIVAGARFVLAVLEEHPLDVALLKRVAGVNTAAASAEHGLAARELARVFAQREAEDARSPTPKLRSAPANRGVQYRVGGIFQHRKYGYIAVITDWDPTCAQSMAWQSAMGIDGLERGARQPFYSSWRADTQGSHYVAEENINLFTTPQPDLHFAVRAFAHLPAFGASFATYRCDPPRYIPGATLRAKYPED